MTSATSLPVVEMAHAVASHQAAMFTLRRFDDDMARGPSLLPNWSRAHVVAHLARHADGHRRLLEAVIRGDRVAQYPGGAEGRAHEIELTSRRGAAELVADFQRASEELFAVWERMPEQLWDADTETVVVGPRQAKDLVRARWWELEIHHVDLDLGFGPSNWPRAFVTWALRAVVDGIPRRRTGDAASSSGTFILRSPQGDGPWAIEVGTDATAVRAITAGEVDGTLVEGQAWALLFWLLGRAPLDRCELEVVGDGAAASALPRAHPYP